MLKEVLVVEGKMDTVAVKKAVDAYRAPRATKEEE